MARQHGMVRQQAIRYGKRRAVRRLSRSLPWVGTAVAVLAIGETIRRKGLVRGSLDSALNAVPFVGTLKALAETVRGRDFFSDRPVNRPVAVPDRVVPSAVR